MDQQAQVFDFIIVGGGTSGLAVAGRLASSLPEKRILVIEAGSDRSSTDEVQMVGRWSSGFGTSNDWNYQSQPNAHINNRTIELSRARSLGGCSTINGTAIVRGVKQDYDDVCNFTTPSIKVLTDGFRLQWGLDGWDSKSFWEYMKKSETFHPTPDFKHDPTFHGYDGPIHTSPHSFAPISEKLFDSLVSLQIPRDDDMFSRGNLSHGCGNACRTVWQGHRSNSTAYLANGYPNLTVLTNTAVLQILLEGYDGDLKATGVVVLEGKENTKRVIKADGEIILAAGAYGSPHLLLLSGIGPKEHLEENEIKVKVNLPGVGRSLQDHVLVFLFYECNDTSLTLDKFLYEEGGPSGAAYSQWKNTRTGALSAFPSGPFAFIRLDERLNKHELWRQSLQDRKDGRDAMGLTSEQPHAELFCTECYFGPKQFNNYPKNGEAVFGINVELFSQKSRGFVELRNSDPLSMPLIDHAFLSDPLDALVLTEAVRLANDIAVTGEGTRELVKGSWPQNSRHHTYTTYEEWLRFTRENATTCYHASGTCKMGSPEDPLAVVDTKLKVTGVARLRVADCSILPTLISGHTQAPAYGIGEKCAAMVLEDWTG